MNMQQQIETKIKKVLQPTRLEVQNESHKHQVPVDSESHFRVVVVSDQFEGKMLIMRHRIVNEILKEELAGGIHALALQTLTDKEYVKKAGKLAHSPQCMGGNP